MNVTVVLPAYNEEQNLPVLLEKLGSVLSNPQFGESRIIVVDDGSTDGTAAVVREACLRHPVLLVQHEKNRGLGDTLKTGLIEASKRDGVVVTMDADNTHDPALIPELVTMIERGSDVAIASRFQRGGAMIGVPVHRRFLSIAASRIMGAIFPHPGVRDYSTGYRAYRSVVLRDLIEDNAEDLVTQRGFAAMVELLLKLRRDGARIGEVPFVLRYDRKRGASKMVVSRTVWGYFRLMATFGLPGILGRDGVSVESS